MNNQRGFSVVIILVAAVLILVAGGGYYFYHYRATKPLLRSESNLASSTPQSLLNQSAVGLNRENDKKDSDNIVRTVKKVDTTSEFEDPKTSIHIKTDVVQTVNCGSEDCFEQKFTLCEPASLELDIGFAAFHYQILGPAAGGCKMTVKYTKNPNADWVDKEMTCVFDNKIDFEKSAQNTINGVIKDEVVCEGELYDIFHSL
jgi:hypothetical protein